MTIALIDNGSLEPAAHLQLRSVAAALAERVGVPVTAVSWKHSDRIPASELGGSPAWTVVPWVQSQTAAGERHFIFVPFFVSAQGAVASALRRDIEKLLGKSGEFAAGLDDGDALAAIVAERIRETIGRHGLHRPPVIIVDHGGPEPASARLRDAVADRVRTQLGSAIGTLAAASMESPEGPAFAFNQPLFAGQLAAPGFDRGDVAIAPLFLAPGRHAGPAGDLERIARAAGAARPGRRCHFTGLIGTHPLATEVLARHLSSLLPFPVLS